MCMSTPKSSGTEAIINQLNQRNQGATLSTAKVASTTSEKKSNNRKVNSLRVPLKNTTDTSTTGVNTTDTVTGLNIPV